MKEVQDTLLNDESILQASMQTSWDGLDKSKKSSQT